MNGTGNTNLVATYMYVNSSPYGNKVVRET